DGDRDRAARFEMPADALDAKTDQVRAAHARWQLESAAAAPAWINLGPDSGTGDGPDALENDSGRLTSVVLDPADPLTIHIAAANGLWRSTDDGASFTQPSLPGLTSTYEAWALRRLSNTDLLVSVQDDGNQGVGSVYVSHDAGATWSASTLIGTTGVVGRIV